MKKGLLALVLFVASCAAVRPVYVYEGKQVYKATCNGLIRDISDCYALASEQCLGNYEITDTIENETDNFSFIEEPEVKKTEYKNNVKITTSQKNDVFPKFGNKIIKRSILFYCK